MQTPMKLFVGLGNIGAKYARNRHNVGFMIVDRIAEDHGFSPWKRKFQGEVAEGRLGTEKVLILKPHTMMNLSGQAVGEAMRYHKLSPDEIVVFHDEIDLAPGKCRVKFGGGHAGNNGLRSLHAHIGEAYGRVRIGVGHPGHKDKVPGYVLKDFPKADEGWLDDVIRGCSDGAARLAAGDGPGFMNVVALRAAPQRAHQGAPAAHKSKAVAPAPQAAKIAGDEGGHTRKSLETGPEPAKSPLQALLDKFGKS